MEIQIGDMISFSECPDDFSGIEAKVVSISDDGVVAHLLGTDKVLVFGDLWGSWDSLGLFKVDRNFDGVN